MIVRLRRLFMVQCAFPIPAAVCLAIISREEMPTEVPVISVPMEICYCGRDQTGRISAGL